VILEYRGQQSRVGRRRSSGSAASQRQQQQSGTRKHRTRAWLPLRHAQGTTVNTVFLRCAESAPAMMVKVPGSTTRCLSAFQNCNAAGVI